MKTQNAKQVKHAQKRTIGAAEGRYRTAISKLRAISRNRIPKETQVEIAYLINKVDSYGFNFFPNLYVYDDITKLEELAKTLNKKGE